MNCVALFREVTTKTKQLGESSLEGKEPHGITFSRFQIPFLYRYSFDSPSTFTHLSIRYFLSQKTKLGARRTDVSMDSYTSRESRNIMCTEICMETWPPLIQNSQEFAFCERCFGFVRLWIISKTTATKEVEKKICV